MMSFIKKDNFKKITLVVLFIMLFNIIIPLKAVEAKRNKTSILASPIRSLLINVTTGINNVFTYVMSGEGFEVSSVEDLEKEDSELEKRTLSPEDIFSGSDKVPISNVNIFEADSNASGGPKGLVSKVKKSVQDLYLFFRNLSAIVMLSALIYVGIMIILNTSNPQAQSEWKQRILQWLKGLILVMFIHVLMISILYFSQIITNTLKGLMNGDKTILQTITTQIEETENTKGDKLITAFLFVFASYAMWVFGVAYLKRFMYMMVLIVIAPIFGALYGMGKFGHERFKHWFREFVAGVMVQPFHMLIFSILIQMPLDILNNGGETDLYIELYAILAILMIRPIEKFVRGLFGFSNTMMDNVSSFESGKKTLGAGINLAAAGVRTAITVGSAVATGGASLLGNLGKTGGQGEETNEDTMLNRLKSSFSQKGDTESQLDSFNQNVDRNKAIKEIRDAGDAPKEDNENVKDPVDYKSLDQFHDGYRQWYLNSGMPQKQLDNAQVSEQKPVNLSEEEIQSQLDNLGLEGPQREEMAQLLREANSNKTPTQAEPKQEVEKIDKPQNNQTNLENTKNQEVGNAEIDKANFKEPVADKEEDKQDKEKIDSGAKADLEASTVIVKGDNVKVGDGKAENEPKLDLKDANAVMDKQLGLDEEKEKSKLQKVLEGGKNVALGAHNAIHSSDAREKYKETWDAMHTFSDSLYTQGGSGDTHFLTNMYETYTKWDKERVENKFINNQGNIEAVIKERNLEDKHDKAGNVIKSKEEQAQEFLKNAVPYVDRGITDIKVISELMDNSGKKGGSIGPAMTKYIEDQLKGIVTSRVDRGQAKVSKNNIANFTSNVQNKQVVANAVAQSFIDQGKNINNPDIRRQIDSAIKAEMTRGSGFVAAGIAKDAARMMDLNRLSDEIAKRIKVSTPEERTQTTVKLDKIVQEAMEKGLKEIKLPPTQGVPAKTTVEIEKMLNKELERRLTIEGARGRNNTQNTPQNAPRTASTQQRPTTANAPAGNQKSVGDGKQSTKTPKDTNPKPGLNSGDNSSK